MATCIMNTSWYQNLNYFAVVREFCRISIEFIKTGANPKVYQTAARKSDNTFASRFNIFKQSSYF